MNDLSEVTKDLIKFRDLRDWKQFHNPKDLAIALNIESSELLEVFLWRAPEEASIDKIEDELADIFSFAILIAEHYKFDIKSIILKKIESNNLKYPIDKAKGTAKKYNEL